MFLVPRWRRRRSESVRVKTKPLPPPKRLRGDDNDEKTDERLEMKELVTSTLHDDKDDEYYFEDPSNIGNYITTTTIYSH